MDFEKSETLKNLTRAFEAECADGAKYQYMADEATQVGQSYISTILKQLATNEMAHAKIMYDYILSKKPGGVEMVEFKATYPMQGGKLEEMLKIKGENEQRQANKIYPAFAKTAEKEGFSDIAKKLQQIATIEACHGDVLLQLHQKLANDTLYSADKATLFKCTNCGHEDTLKKAWKKCPLCSKGQGMVKINLCGSAKDCDC